MINVLIFLAVLSLLILIHEWGHFIVARRSGVRVLRFSMGFGPIVWRHRCGGTEYVLSAIPLGGYVKMAGETPEDESAGQPDEFLAQPMGVRARIIAAGPVLNYVLALVAFILVFWLGNPTLEPVVGKVLEGTPAQRAGVQSKDRILAINDRPVASWEEMTDLVRHKTTGAVTVQVERAGRRLAYVILPEVKARTDVFGRVRQTRLLGIGPAGDVKLVRAGFWAAIGKGARHTLELTGLTCYSLWALLTGGVSMQESVTGPIGIFFITTDAVRLGAVYLIQIIGVLSLSLAIFNFLPIPVLDGGHLFFLVCEKLRGRPVRPVIQERATQTGMAVLLVFVLFVCYNDIARYGIAGKVMTWFKH